MKKTKLFAYFIVAGLCSIASVPGHAESGTVEIVLSAVSTSTAVQMGDATVTARGGSGTVTLSPSSENRNA